jgi:probable HAF family extracellular repeat protein
LQFRFPYLRRKIGNLRDTLLNSKLVDMGTFGGPGSFFFSAPVVESVNNRRTVVGGADTPASGGGSPDGYIIHAFRWHDGVLTDLGTLPGGNESTAFWVNEPGSIMGSSGNGVIDPILQAPQQICVIWINGQIIDLGTLGGGVSFGNAMNNRDQVVGISVNTIPDPVSILGLGTQTRAFLWRGRSDAGSRHTGWTRCMGGLDQ